MKNFVILFVSAMVVISCKPKSAPDQAPIAPAAKGDYSAYETEIMKIHDAAMPKMSELNQLETQLRNRLTKATQSDLGSSAIPEGLNDAIEAVKSAQSGMLDWMQNYSAVKANLPPDQMLKFMEKELQKVSFVRDKMDNSITKAKDWLGAHPE